jgi:hypothetical protein
MAYEDKSPPSNPETRINNKTNHDECIKYAVDSGVNQMRTDAYAEGVGYLGVDDLNRIRRRKLGFTTKTDIK